ncbi:hypothetical protein F511_12432 [Dorcoceras hygrometricum]|uniref:Uncharacterized protein n=1 Tax=Dorcoceras hygrometricum TaxID=472368 RepID=A0A2Z7C642_9LAMI|nr:hypothetical protein F511_12432 [Dorcoceras hygrometricum]
MQAALSKLATENDELRSRSQEMLSENQLLAEIISSWTRSSASLDKLHGAMKPSDDRSGLGYGSNDSSKAETSCIPQLDRTKFQTMNFVRSSTGQPEETQSDEPTVTRLCCAVECFAGESSQGRPRGVCQAASLENNISVLTYMKKHQTVVLAGESSKQTGDTASGTKGVQSQRAVAGRQAASAKSMSGTSSDEDSCPLSKLGTVKKGDDVPNRKLVLESSDSESTVSLPLQLAFRVSDEKPTEEQPTQQEEQVEEIDPTVENVDETEDVNFQECQAQAEKQPAPEDGKQALEQPAPKENDQPQPDPTQSKPTLSRFSFSSNSVNNEDLHDPDPSSLAIVKYTGKQADKQITPEEAQRVQQLTNLPPPTPIDRIGIDTYLAKNIALKFRQQLDTKIDGLETSLVRHFTDSQQNLAGDIALLKSHVAEMVECLNEIRDAKKREDRTVCSRSVENSSEQNWFSDNASEGQAKFA